MAKIKMKNSVTAADTFRDFHTGKKAAGVSEKTLATYGQHFSAISRHLSPDIPKETHSDEELKKFLKKPDMKKCGFPEYRNWAIINFLLNNGCRAATIRRLPKLFRTQQNYRGPGKAVAFSAGSSRSCPGVNCRNLQKPLVKQMFLWYNSWDKLSKQGGRRGHGRS